MRTRLTFWMIFLARNAAEDVKLSLMYTLGWLGLKDSQGVRFVAAARAQLSCIVRSEHYSCSPWAPLAALTTARLAAEFSIEERSSQSEPPLRDSLASQSGPGITGSDQSEAPSLLSPGSRGRPGRARALLSLLAPVTGEYPATFVIKAYNFPKGHPTYLFRLFSTHSVLCIAQFYPSPSLL